MVFETITCGPLTKTIEAGFPAGLTAALKTTGGSPADPLPFPDHGAINYLLGAGWIHNMPVRLKLGNLPISIPWEESLE